MKVLVYFVCILASSMIFAACRANGILLGGIPTMLIYLAFMFPAWKFGENYDRKKYKEKYPNSTLAHITDYVLQLQNRLLIQEISSTPNDLIGVNDVFSRASEHLLQHTEDEILKHPIQEKISPEVCALNIVIDCAYKLYSEKRKEFKNDKDKLSEIKDAYHRFCESLNNIALEIGYIDENQHKIKMSVIQESQEKKDKEEDKKMLFSIICYVALALFFVCLGLYSATIS